MKNPCPIFKNIGEAFICYCKNEPLDAIFSVGFLVIIIPLCILMQYQILFVFPYVGAMIINHCYVYKRTKIRNMILEIKYFAKTGEDMK
jgi:hypothetical protein